MNTWILLGAFFIVGISFALGYKKATWDCFNSHEESKRHEKEITRKKIAAALLDYKFDLLEPVAKKGMQVKTNSFAINYLYAANIRGEIIKVIRSRGAYVKTSDGIRRWVPLILLEREDVEQKKIS